MILTPMAVGARIANVEMNGGLHGGLIQRTAAWYARTSNVDFTEDSVIECSTTDLRSPDISDVPDRSVNFFCCSMERSASAVGAHEPLALRRQSSPSEARMLATNVRRSGSENERGG